jgi:IclR family acetate operon transcriptional repressor
VSEPVGPLSAPRPGGVRSIDRAVAILRCFDRLSPELGISDLAGMTGLSTSTVRRLLAAMQANHLVRQTAGKRYELGPIVRQLANSGAVDRRLRDTAMPFMVALRDELDETIGLHELVLAGKRIVVAQVESRQQLRRTYTDIGTPIPLISGGPSKAILLALPDGEWPRFLAEKIENCTATTTTDPAEIARELRAARHIGFVVSRGQKTEGVTAVAAPIFDHTQRAVGALGASVPESRMSVEREVVIGARIRGVAWQLSTALGAVDAGVRARVPDVAFG